MADIRSIRSICLKWLLKPVAKYCVRSSLTLQDIVDAAKDALVQAAREELTSKNSKVNITRISLLTGVHRLDVATIYKQNESPIRKQASLLARVLGQWENDSRFKTRGGAPKVLSLSKGNNEFEQLILSISKHLTPSSILSQLKQRGMVTISGRGVRLNTTLNVIDREPEKRFELLAKNIESLITSVEENLLLDRDPKNLNLRTEFDNILRAAIPEIRRWLLDQGRDFHRRAREFIAQHDQDITPHGDSENQAGAIVTLGSFSVVTEDR